MKGSLYLLPNTLGNPDTSLCIPEQVSAIASATGVFIVENLRNARRYLKALDKHIDIDRLVFHELNEHTPASEVGEMLAEVMEGRNAAILSEAGVPGVADPGSLLVNLAHRKGIRVIPLTGPSSILMSLMASGFNGQSFTFHGYLPVKRPERIRRIRELEQQLTRSGETQIFIEAPYRNMTLLDDLLEQCGSQTQLCIAADITMDSEFIATREIADWKKQKPALHKRPAIFLLGRS